MPGHPRVKPSGWSEGDELTYTEINQLDGYCRDSVDKTSRGDTISGHIVWDGYSSQTLESGHDFLAEDGAEMRIECPVNFTGTGSIEVSCPATFDSDSAVQLSGTVEFNDSSVTTFDTDSVTTHLTGSTDTYNTGSTLAVNGTFAAVNETLSGSTGLTLSHASGKVVFTVAKTVTRMLTNPTAEKHGADGFKPDAGWQMVQQTVTSPGSVLFEIDAPDDAVLQEVHVRLDGGSGHGDLPSTLPVVTVYKMDLSGGATVLDSQVDTSANFTAYEAPHYISITGLGETLDRISHRYIVNISGEKDADSEPFMVVRQCAIVYTLLTYSLQ